MYQISIICFMSLSSSKTLIDVSKIERAAYLTVPHQAAYSLNQRRCPVLPHWLVGLSVTRVTQYVASVCPSWKITNTVKSFIVIGHLQYNQPNCVVLPHGTDWLCANDMAVRTAPAHHAYLFVLHDILYLAYQKATEVWMDVLCDWRTEGQNITTMAIARLSQSGPPSLNCFLIWCLFFCWCPATYCAVEGVLYTNSPSLMRRIKREFPTYHQPFDKISRS